MIKYCLKRNLWILFRQQLIFSSGSRITNKQWKEGASKLLKEKKFVFFGYRDMLGKAQWNLLKSIAMDIAVYPPTSSDFISKYSLGSSATVNHWLSDHFHSCLEEILAEKHFYYFYSLDLPEQEDELQATFEKWLGSNERGDDMMLTGSIVYGI